MNKRSLAAVVVGILTVTLFCVFPASSDKRSLKDGLEKTSYAFGVNVGTGLKASHADFDLALIRRGLKDAMAGRTLLSPSESRAALACYGRDATSAQKMSGQQPAFQIFHLFDPLKDARAKASYAFGANIGAGWKQIHAGLLPDAAAQGIKDAATGANLLLSTGEADQTISSYGKELMVRQQEERRQLAEKNKKEGEAFLAQNGRKPNIVTLPCGVQYKVIAEGAGNSPAPENYVSVKYRGTFIDGKEFEVSSGKHKANILGLSSIITGLSEVLQLMKPGSKWQVFIPPSDAYGIDGGPGVPPNATLIYDLELVSILPGRPDFQVDNSD